MSVGKPIGSPESALTHSTFLPRWKASVTCWSSTTECGAGRLSLGSPSYGSEEAACSALRSHVGRLRRGSLDPNVPEGRWVLGRWRKLKVIGIHRPHAETHHLQAEAIASDEQNLDADVAARLVAHCAP